MNLLDYNLQDFTKDVYEFNNISGQAKKLGVMPCGNQIRLMHEEVEETAEAFRCNDVVEILDGCVDTLYVTLGLLQKLENLGCDVHGALEAVAENNLSKFPRDAEVAAATVEFYATQGIACEVGYNEIYDRFAIKDENQKVRKPLGYLRCSLDAFVPDALKQKGLE
jgi:predicted HAD superfamily Cof-like phosphohydrolase